MDSQTIVFWFILDPITFGLGSIGAYLIFHEVTGLDHFPSLNEVLHLLKKHWVACLFLAIAIGYFFYRLFSVVSVAQQGTL
jgi:hypothetical protein